mmetsp:Transcript_28962/g.47832  ORF Transcript_28962/g.47832 Transcript_28962/m.47832 type:complete len:136 (-) Transcript_28962:150-557(-)|eukprot:CAMPEP_0119012438 /NCGR_PEP_ID=MMETSP1176-20130426/6729_1 /TAXON_ID=265551 /ORGANISM="Synedropsis recta cf, Strain CCMP1620" /LENGTH=135 /DNA_ID=CAMNT_0006965397 /DNA_START=78 /DNA_END=485 /DNA_ORIENTATION=-
MFAMRQTVPRVARVAIRNVSSDIRPSFVPKNYQKHGAGKDWLSDPSTYPIIAIMGFAGAFVVGMAANTLMTAKDVQIDPNKRSSIVRTWGEGDSQPLTGKAIWRWSWQKTNPEGMGVDHDEWLEGKKEYQEDKKS